MRSSVAVKSSSFLFNTSFSSDNNSSIVVSEDSILESNEPAGPLGPAEHTGPVERKVINPRPSLATTRTSMPRLSETRQPQSVLPNPRKSIALNSALITSKPSDRQTLPNPLLPRQSKLVSPIKPTVTSAPPIESKGLSPKHPTPIKNPPESQRVEEPSQSIIDVLTSRKELFHSIHSLLKMSAEKTELIRLLKESEDATVISTCFKECPAVLTPSSMEELAEISPLITICLKNKTEV